MTTTLTATRRPWACGFGSCSVRATSLDALAGHQAADHAGEPDPVDVV